MVGARGSDSRDVLVVLLVSALAAWALVSRLTMGGLAWPMVALLAGAAVTLFASRALDRRFGTLVPAVVAAGVALLALASGSEAIGNTHSPLGYQNASAAMYVAGVAAAGLVVLRDPRPAMRTAFSVVGTLLVLLPLLAGAVAGVLGMLLVGGAVLAVRDGRVRDVRASVRIAAAMSVLAVLATGVLGVLHQPSTDGSDGDVLRRLALWDEAIELMVARPVAGVGPGRFAELGTIGATDQDARWAHHEFLQVGAETGVPGLVLLVGLVVAGFAWLDAAPSRRGAVVGSALLLATVAHACIDYVWHFPLVVLAIAAVLGSCTAVGPVRTR